MNLIRIGVLSAGVGVSSILLMAPTEITTAATEPPALVVDFMAAPYAESCYDQVSCALDTKHEMMPGTEFHNDGHTCNAPRYHAGPTCPGGDPGEEGFAAERVLRASPDQLVAMISAGSNVIWNTERRTVQVLGCDGVIDLNIPADQELVAKLTI